MRRALGNIWWLARKEILGILRDVLLLGLVVYAFGPGIYLQSNAAGESVNNAAVAFVDNDRSALSRAMQDALHGPWFQRPDLIEGSEIDAAMDADLYTFVVVVPRGLESDLRRGRAAVVQLNVDATDVSQASVGAGYVESILLRAVRDTLGGTLPAPQVDLVVHRAFNPNGNNTWFEAVSGLLNWLTILTIILTGAALIREREHGTIGHLLVMPITPFDIAMAKVLSNAAVVFAAFILSLVLVVQMALGVPVAGSVPLLLSGTFVYLFAAAAVGVLLATVARTMSQFALLVIITVLPMMILSGGMSPVESQPQWLQYLTWFLPSRHYMAFAEGVVYRGAGLSIVWPEFLLVAVLGAAFLGVALALFRRSVASA
ncbi:ABC transporter permease [Jannaschia rubra]|uniref:Inner membrane transport permease YhhJ n=1 Tax=Jannaschia rubra TaxID=282197 RepID=A0A0M6XTY9_9RHOB|nr:ABC transporter permease [Jannaschia rubra]CTQ34570.1 Inner membrane transport permease YhhJ [Jannaschia rubra]SFG71338.1 ABC-2 type transport system permease protein [Jannaschia rubra]